MISHSPIISIFSLKSLQLAILYCMGALSTLLPISCSSIGPSAFRHSDFSPLAAASCLNPQSMLSLWLHNTSCSWQWFLALVPLHVGHPHSHPMPSIHTMDSWWSLGSTTHAVPYIGSSVLSLHFGSAPHFPMSSSHITAMPPEGKTLGFSFLFFSYYFYYYIIFLLYHYYFTIILIIIIIISDYIRVCILIFRNWQTPILVLWAKQWLISLQQLQYTGSFWWPGKLALRSHANIFSWMKTIIHITSCIVPIILNFCPGFGSM